MADTNRIHDTSQGFNSSNITTTNSSTVTEEERQRYLDQLQAETTMTMIPSMAFLVTLAVFGLIGNSLVIVVYTGRQKWSATTILIITLAFVDLVANLVAIPSEIYGMFHVWQYDNWTLCRVDIFSSTFSTLSSGMVLLAVSIVRYRKVCKPHNRQVTPGGAKTICVVVISLGVIISIPYTIISGRHTKKTPRSDIVASECTLADEYVDTIWPLLYLVFFLLMYVVCSGCLIVMYVLIGRKAWKHRRMSETRASSVILSASTSASGNENFNAQRQPSRGISSNSDTSVPTNRSAKAPVDADRTGRALQGDQSYHLRLSADRVEVQTPNVDEFFVNLQQEKSELCVLGPFDCEKESPELCVLDLGACEKESPELDILTLRDSVKTKPELGVVNLHNCWKEKPELYVVECYDCETTTPKLGILEDLDCEISRNDSQENEDEILHDIGSYTDVTTGATVEKESNKSKTTLEKEPKNTLSNSNRTCTENIASSNVFKEGSAEGFSDELSKTAIISHSRQMSDMIDSFSGNTVLNQCNSSIYDRQSLYQEHSRNSEPLSVLKRLDVIYYSDGYDISLNSNAAGNEANLSFQLSLNRNKLQSREWLSNNTKNAMMEPPGNSNGVKNKVVADTKTETKMVNFSEDKRESVVNKITQSLVDRRASSAQTKIGKSVSICVPSNISVRKLRTWNRTNIKLVVISAIYTLGYFPYLGLLFVYLVYPETLENMSTTGEMVYNLLLRSFFLNCAVNPIVYSLCDKNFRKECNQLFKRSESN